MNFDWKYGLISNIPYLLLLIIGAASFSSSIINTSHSYFLLIGIAIAIILLYYFFWERPFFREHPEYKPANRQITRLGWLIAAIGCGAILLLIGISSQNNFLLIWPIFTLTIFIRDSLSRAKYKQ